MKNSDPCPCRSGRAYAACCRPAHLGAVPPATCGALVRARYSAFALGDGEYLYATLAHDHPDRAADPEAADARIAELARAGRTLKYMGVVVSDETETEALFLAKVFERGQDRSFAELSTFTRSPPEEGGGLRYAGGTLLPRAALPRAVADGVGLRRDAFLALAATHKDTVRS
ncbi:MAG TPA: YchJ family metal-binding protein [Polyangiaceae bacterium]|nr:YchJ family metal-binding protein [Polyangiaceae bacterium]